MKKIILYFLLFNVNLFGQYYPSYGPGEQWSYNSSSQSAFIYFDNPTLYGETIGEPFSGSEECPTEDCDIFAAIYNGICVGWVYSYDLFGNGEIAMNISLNDGDPVTAGYPVSNAAFQPEVSINFYDASEGIVYYNIIAVEVYPMSMVGIENLNINGNGNACSTNGFLFGIPESYCSNGAGCNNSESEYFDAIGYSEINCNQDCNQDCNGDCDGNAIENECGCVLGFTGNASDFCYGCIDNTACNYDSDATNYDDSCIYPEINYDCEGNCIGELDCLGICEGNAVFDDCGVCNGDGPEQGYDCYGNCLGDNDGDGICNDFDDCDGLEDCDGNCEGDNWDCEIVFSLDLEDDGILGFYAFNPGTQVIGGFNLEFWGMQINNVFGGLAEDYNFTLSFEQIDNEHSRIVGFSNDGSFIPNTNDDALFYIDFDNFANEICPHNLALTGQNGEDLLYYDDGCHQVCDYYNTDCANICGGNATLEECGGIFTPNSNETTMSATNLWIENNEQAMLLFGPINDWDMSQLEGLENTFDNLSTFNDDISNWDVSNVISFWRTFNEASDFNQDISSWDVSRSEIMHMVFNGATSFNQDISNWDVSNVHDMHRLFHGAESFNQDISSWDVSNVHDMASLLRDAISFDQDISGWDVSNVENMDGMFENTALSSENKCSIHLAFSENENWPYDWSYECSLVDCEGDVDECGVCNGDGIQQDCGCGPLGEFSIPEGACDCSGNILDYCGICNGENVYNEYVCNPDCELSASTFRVYGSNPEYGFENLTYEESCMNGWGVHYFEWEGGCEIVNLSASNGWEIDIQPYWQGNFYYWGWYPSESNIFTATFADGSVVTQEVANNCPDCSINGQLNTNDGCFECIDDAWNLTNFNQSTLIGEGFSSGSNFWAADTSGGYLNNWLQFMDTPTISVGDSAEIQASIYYAIENAEGAEGYNGCIDGWDAANVRISSDGGLTWDLLEDDDNPYHFECGYGWIHNDDSYQEGEELNHLASGWGGLSNEWFLFKANLSQYSNEDIIIRFAFGSDGYVSFSSDDALTGFQVDDIIIYDTSGLIYSNNCSEEESMIVSGSCDNRNRDNKYPGKLTMSGTEYSRENRNCGEGPDVGCDGVCFSEAEYDYCGECGGEINGSCSSYPCYWNEVSEILLDNPTDCQNYANENNYEFWGIHYDAENHCVETGCYCLEEDWGFACEWQGNCSLGEGCDDSYSCYWNQISEVTSIAECQVYANEIDYEYWGNHYSAEEFCVETGCYCSMNDGACEWQSAEAWLVGDINLDNNVDILDLITLINHILGFNLLYEGQALQADLSGDGIINIVDAVQLIEFIIGDDLVKGNSPNFININIDDKYLSVKSDGNIAGLQIEYKGEFEIISNLIPEDWEINYNDKTILCYSLSGSQLIDPKLFEFRGDFEIISAIGVDWNGLVMNADIQVMPNSYLLEPAYPNPFNPITNISYSLPEDNLISIDIYDVEGKKIASLINGIKTIGNHSVEWNAEGYPSGVYFVKLDAGKFTQTQKLMLVK